jgi:serine/threonine-protein kinase RsbW
VVRHAHKEQADVPVLLRLELKGQMLALEIWDSGTGFDLTTYMAPDPTTCQEGGYGWLIMTRLMDRVEYQLQVNGNKNCLKLETRLLPKEIEL